MKKLLSLVLIAILAATLVGACAEGHKIGMLPKFKGENYFDGCYVGA